MGLRDDLIRQGWRQGAFLPREGAEHLRNEFGLPIGDDARCLIITQTCDLVSDSLEWEPHAEILVGYPVVKLDGSLTFGKSTRRLHLPLSVDGVEEYVELRVRDWYRVPRGCLTEFAAAFQFELSDSSLLILRHWAGARYSRAALPDAFNARLAVARKGIGRALKADGRHLTALYLAIEPFEEIMADATYRLSVYGVMSKEEYSDPEARASGLRALDGVSKALKGVSGIELEEVDLVGEDRLTLDDLRYLVEWRWDHLSLREDPHGLLPATRDPR
jgi:hypothetical protein